MHAGRNRRVGRLFDAVARLKHSPRRHVDLADHAGVQLIDGFANGGRRASLRSMLAHAVVLASRQHQLPPFPDIVRAGLLDVRVLARLHGPDASQRVPVVGRGNADGVDVRVVDELAEVGEPLDGVLGHGLQTLGPPVEDRLIHVAQGHHLGAGHLQVLLDLRIAAAANANHADANDGVRTARRLFVRGFLFRGQCATERDRGDSAACCGRFQKLPAGYRIHVDAPAIQVAKISQLKV